MTPLKWQAWREDLEGHPDRKWVEWITRGIQNGFRVGHDQERVVLREKKGIMYEGSQHREVIRKYLEEEEGGGRIHKVIDGESRVQCSPFGVIPKKGKPGRWRLIVNLSAPEGASVNDGIDKELASVAYTSVDEVVRRVVKLGRGAELAKADIKAAYRNVPVHPKDRWLLGMRWEGETYVDGTLPFGLRSAPLIFTALGDAIQWIAMEKGATWLRHYVDDFVSVGAKGSGECARSLRMFKETCERLGMPLDEKKTEGPTEVIKFLGIEIDSINMELRLPQEKLSELLSVLTKGRGMKCCRKKDLQSIVGSLNHACIAVRAGRSFKRRLQDLIATVVREDRRVRLNVEARADLEWWYQFGTGWNGTALMQEVPSDPRYEVVSDASGSWGCGAEWSGKWFQLSWNEAQNAKEWSIMPKELLPIVIAAVVWGEQWKGSTIKAWCDNSAVVATIRTGSCKEKRAMHLRRCLAFVEAVRSVTIGADHIKGVDNVVADALSRDKLEVALSYMQAPEERPTEIPEGLVELLTSENHSWSEQEWQMLRRYCSSKH